MDSSSENKEAEESDTDTVARYGSLILIKFCTLYLIYMWSCYDWVVVVVFRQ